MKGIKVSKAHFWTQFQSVTNLLRKLNVRRVKRKAKRGKGLLQKASKSLESTRSPRRKTNLATATRRIIKGDDQGPENENPRKAAKRNPGGQKIKKMRAKKGKAIRIKSQVCYCLNLSNMGK